MLDPDFLDVLSGPDCRPIVCVLLEAASQRAESLRRSRDDAVGLDASRLDDAISENEVVRQKCRDLLGGTMFYPETDLERLREENDALRAELGSTRKKALQEAIEVLKHRAISVELSTLCFPDENVTRKWALAVSNELDRAWQELEILADIPTAEEATRD